MSSSAVFISPRAAIVTAIAAVSLASAWWLSREPSEPVPPGETPTPPPHASDPLNPAVYIAGGEIPRTRRAPDGDRRVGDPRSTEGEGLGGARAGPFWIQRHEVTNEEYRRFVPDHAYPDSTARHPVTNVTWEEAMAYAVSIGGRLPTETEWEFTARGAEGRTYPWGEAEPTCELAHFQGCGGRSPIEVMGRPAGATPEGIHDLAGNVWEWVMPVWFEPGRTPVNDEVRRMRGGSFDDEAFFLRSVNRSNDFPAGFRYISDGFRVVWPARPD